MEETEENKVEVELEGEGSFSLLVENDSNLRPLVAKESHFSGLGKGEFGDLEVQCPEFRTQEEFPSSRKEG